MSVGLVSDLVLQQLRQPADGPRMPLKLQVYEALRQAILENRLAAGTRLPATRALADELGVGRNTVMRAYEQLLAEGYVEGKVGSGTYVAETLQDSPSGEHRPPPVSTRPGRPRLSRRGDWIASHAAASSIQHGAFMPGIPDVELFPHKLWRRLVDRYLRAEHSRLLQYAAGGYGPLRVVLAQYLRVTRFVPCDPRQVIIVNGSHQALDLCARMLADIDDTVWIEEPGYWGARHVFHSNGLQIRAIKVDEAGIAPDAADWVQPPRLIFVSPSCQYPTGAVLTLPRRRALLEGAQAHGAWVIEDDYDNELRYHKQPLASLYGLAGSDSVIYIGTFSKVMFPGLRLAYLVVPPALVDAFSVGNAELYREGRLVEQAALAEFISEGHLASHIRKMRMVYAERQSVLRERLESRLGDQVVLSGGQAGIHLLYRLPAGVDDERLAREAMAAGVIIRPLSLYYHEPSNRQSGMMLGYAGVKTERIRRAADSLAEVVEKHQRQPTGRKRRTR